MGTALTLAATTSPSFVRLAFVHYLNHKEEDEDQADESEVDDGMLLGESLCTEIIITFGLQAHYQTTT